MAYTNSPAVAWAGWRYRIQGGPIGGQYHGFVGPDETESFMGWPAGPNEMIRPMDDYRGLGNAYPWEPWAKHVWGGTRLMEGQTVSDFVYRSSAEVRPRPNASGGVNVVSAIQYPRTAGFAMSPGNMKTLGAVAMPSAVAEHVASRMIPAPASNGGSVAPIVAQPMPVYPPVRPVGPARWNPGAGPAQWSYPWSPAPSPSVPQPPPPTGPQPTSTVGIGPAGTSGCPQGQYRDAAGNCTSDWTNPYALYLPLDNAAQPAPVVSANTCPTGYVQDGNGNCLAQCPAGDTVDVNGNCIPPSATSATGIMAWLEETNQTLSNMGLPVPNMVVAGVGLLLAMRFMKKR